MRITRVNTVNFKGRSDITDLTPVTVIEGNNSKGKSSVVEAIVLALSGFLPVTAKKSLKTAPEIFRLATPNQSLMSVQVKTTDGKDICRMWNKQKETVKASKLFVGLNEDWEMPAIAINPDDYFALSDGDRTKYLFARTKLPDEFKVVTMAQTFTANIKNVKLETNTTQSEAVISELVKLVMDSAAEDANLPPHEWIALIVSEITERLKTANANVKRMASTAQGVVQVKADAAPVAQDAEAKLETARKELEAAQAEEHRLEGLLVQASKLYKETKRIADSAVDESAIELQITTFEHERYQLEGVSQPEAEKDAPIVTSQDVESKRSVLSECKDDLFRASQAGAPDDTAKREALQTARKAANQAQQELARAEGVVQDLESKIAVAHETTKCPHCGQRMDGIIQGVLVDLGEKLVVAKSERSARQTRYDEILKYQTTADSDFVEVCRQIQEHQNVRFELQRITGELEKLETKVRQDTHAAWQFRQDTYLQAQQRLVSIGKQIADLKEKLGNTAANEAAAKLPGLVNEGEKARSEHESAVAHTLLKRSVVTLADGEARRLVAQRAQAQTLAAAAEEKLLRETESEVLKQVKDMLATFQSKLIEQSVAPLLTRCNEFCAALLPAPLAYQQDEIGLDFGGRFVSHWTMSDSEKLSVYCAMSIALASFDEFRLAIIGRFESFDYDRKGVLIRNVQRLIKDGKLDQCLLVEVNGGLVPAADRYAEFTDKDFSVVSR